MFEESYNKVLLYSDGHMQNRKHFLVFQYYDNLQIYKSNLSKKPRLFSAISLKKISRMLKYINMS